MTVLAIMLVVVTALSGIACIVVAAMLSAEPKAISQKRLAEEIAADRSEAAKGAD
jgi:hypothetical protein